MAATAPTTASQKPLGRTVATLAFDSCPRTAGEVGDRHVIGPLAVGLDDYKGLLDLDPLRPGDTGDCTRVMDRGDATPNPLVSPFWSRTRSRTPVGWCRLKL